LKNQFAVRVSFCCLALLLLLASRPASAQTPGYRTNGLASDQPGTRVTSPALLNPWGIAFLPGGNFFIAENASGRVDSYDAAGNLGVGVAIPAPPGSNDAFSKPTGIAAVSEPNIGPVGTSFEFLVAADNGTIWGFTTANGTPLVATRFVDNSAGSASYTGIAFIHPDCCGPYIAVANFADGEVDTFTRSGDRLSLSPATQNPFVDPELPEGFAPFNIQLIGDRIFVTYAQRRADGKPLLVGLGFGSVNVFDTVGNLVQRFVRPGGFLNAPWGITQASANFGPFSNDILVANDGGDGSISAFKPDTGQFVGQLTDADGNFLFFAGLHGLAFRTDGVGDANALYNVDAAAENATPHGSFRTITDGNASFITLNFFLDLTGNGVAAFVLPGDTVTLTTDVPQGPHSGAATGTVSFVDTCCSLLSLPVVQTTLGTVNVVNGSASLRTSFPGGDHVITANYSGDRNFGPGSTSARLGVLLETRIALSAPSSVASGTPVQLSVNVASNPPVQSTSITGQVTFFDGNVILGTVALRSGAAQLTINSLSPGAHSIIAQYSGSEFFQGGQSAPSTVTIGNPAPAIFSMSPFSAKQNSGAFILTVNGFGFVNGAVVTFNGSGRPTTFVSSTQLTAAITAADLASSGTATVAVVNPAPGGGNSGIAMFAIDTATATSVTVNNLALFVTAGQSVSVQAQPTGFSGAITLACLNAPAGVTCAFDQASNSVTIQTATSTQHAAHLITLVFSAQALARTLSQSGSLAMSLGVLGLPLAGVLMEGRRRRKLRMAFLAIPITALLLLVVAGCGGYGSKTMQPNPTPQLQSGQASVVVTLNVQ
jgi:uncharacterized protein (TIGR03118 family)